MPLEHAEKTRRLVSPKLEPKRKSALGQFMTPLPIATFMADMFQPSSIKVCRLLDAGAGLGALTSAFLDRWRSGGFGFERVESTAHEMDDELRQHLEVTLAHYADPKLMSRAAPGDFILQTVLAILEDRAQRHYTHAILNPPYKKMSAGSQQCKALRQVGIETVNLYSAFVSLALELMAPGGMLVAIIPRSFCNGTYYKAFREFMLSKAAILAIHLFDSRSKAFSDDAVLQENIIIMLERTGAQGPVLVTTSTDETFGDLATNLHRFDRIVFPSDCERFIHIPTSNAETELELSGSVKFTLAEIGVRISTGPVVDFRLKDHLRLNPEVASVPILYPMHFAGSGVTWPIIGAKKANSILVNEETIGWLMPVGFYCVVRRFSSKEEKRRIVANVVKPMDFPAGTEFLGFENHINVFNEKRRGLPELLAYGLATFMNSTAVDDAFRRFSGHTQVNAGDLKTIKYPSRVALMQLGQWGKDNPGANQAVIDEQFKQLSL